MKSSLSIALVSILTFTSSLLLAEGGTYYSVFKNENGMVNSQLQYTAGTSTYTVGYLNSSSSRWTQKDNFLLYIPDGVTQVNISFQIDGSYKSIDGFATINNIPDDDISKEDVISYTASSDLYQDMASGKTVYYLGQSSINMVLSNLNQSQNKWLAFKTSSRYYCDPSIGRRNILGLRTSILPISTSGSYSSNTSSSSSSSYSNNSGALPDLGSGSGSNTSSYYSSVDNTAQECCYPSTYASGLKWSMTISYTFDKSYIDNKVTSQNQNCSTESQNLYGDESITNICTYINSIETSSSSKTSNGATFITYSNDPSLNFTPTNSTDGFVAESYCPGSTTSIDSSSQSSSTVTSSSSSAVSTNSCINSVIQLINTNDNKWTMVGIAESGCTADLLLQDGAKKIWAYKNNEWKSGDEGIDLELWDAIWIK